MTEPTPAANADQIACWNERAAPTWVAFQERLDAMMTPITEAALTAAAPADGEAVLDVGCGCGETLLRLAASVGPTGRVTGLDVSGPMTARARERIAAAGLGNVDIILGDASQHELPAGTADLLFSRFGIMFFDDPLGAFTHLRRAMRPGGRMLGVAWRPIADNPWFRVPMEAARHLLPPQPPPDPLAPGPFAFADADRVGTILMGAGWQDVTLTRQDVRLRIGSRGDPAAATEMALHVGALGSALRTLPEQDVGLIRDAVVQALGPYDTGDGVVFPASVWLISARV